MKISHDYCQWQHGSVLNLWFKSNVCEYIVWNNFFVCLPTIMDKSVDTFEQNKRFLSASLRKFKKHLFLPIAQPPLPLFNVEICFVDTVTWLQH